MGAVVSWVDEEHYTLLREEALRLRLEGRTYRDIAKVMGVSKDTAYRYVKRALEEHNTMTAEMANELREMEHARLTMRLEEVNVILNKLKDALSNQEARHNEAMINGIAQGKYDPSATLPVYVPDEDVLKQIKDYTLVAIKISESIRKLMGLDAEEPGQILVPVRMGGESMDKSLGDATRGKSLRDKMNALRDHQRKGVK